MAGFARQSILSEVRAGLQRLCEDGTPTVIDLNRQPFSEAEVNQVLDALGIGEVFAILDALGRSTVQETAFPGVWIVEHRDGTERLQTRQIEICAIPAILCAPQTDVGRGLARLHEILETTPEQEARHA